MKAVADTSSLLSLEYMDLLNPALDITDIYTTRTVEMELKEIAGYNDEKSRIAKKILKLINEERIKSLEAKSKPKYIPTNTCFSLCVSGRIPFLITDDVNTVYYLRRSALEKGIKIRICVALVVELLRTGRIDRPGARKKLGELIKKRSWEGGVLEVLVKRYIEEHELW